MVSSLMGKLLFVLLIFYTSNINGQLAVEPVELKDDEKVSLRFPFITGPNADVAGRINLFLQHEILGNAAIEDNPGSLFSNARYIDTDTIDQPGYIAIDYAILNNRNVLSLHFKGETMAAYPDDFIGYFSFDTKTGKLITVNDIFTKTGLAAVQQELLQKREHRIGQFIKQNFAGSEDSGYIKEQYTNCIKETEQSQICIQNEAVLFHSGPCFPHVARVYDTDLDITIRAEELSRYLSDYGKTILFNIGKQSFKEN